MNIQQLMHERRTFRRFKQNMPIDDNIITDILEAARVSSCTMNRQKLRYAIIKDSDKVEAMFPYTHFAMKLPRELGTPKEGEHPVLYILVLMPDNKDMNLFTDAGIAMANMSAAAYEHGVGSCILGSIERDKIAKLFGIWEYIAYAVAFGYPDHKVTIVEQKDSDAYYLDDNRDYFVPKLSLDEIIKTV